MHYIHFLLSTGYQFVVSVVVSDKVFVNRFQVLLQVSLTAG